MTIMTPDVYIRPSAGGFADKRGATGAGLRSHRDTAGEDTHGHAELRLRLDSALHARHSCAEHRTHPGSGACAALRVHIQYDEKAQAPFFYYMDNSGTQHVVWFDDPRSIEAKLGLIGEYGLAGASWWTVNRCYVPGLLVQQSMYDTVKL